MTAAARALRLDRSTWRRMEAAVSPAGAGLIVMAAYVMVAFDRFGMQAVLEVRAVARVMLVGFYGWVWLVGATWVIVRSAFGFLGSPARLAPLMGHAHLPLLLLAVLIQFGSVALNFTGVAVWPAVFAGLFWMPAMLVSATATIADLNFRAATVAVTGPYLVWLALVGRSLWTQLEHLL